MRWELVPDYRACGYHIFDNLPKVVREAIASADDPFEPEKAQEMLWAGHSAEEVAAYIRNVANPPQWYADSSVPRCPRYL